MKAQNLSKAKIEYAKANGRMLVNEVWNFAEEQTRREGLEKTKVLMAVTASFAGAGLPVASFIIEKAREFFDMELTDGIKKFIISEVGVIPSELPNIFQNGKLKEVYNDEDVKVLIFNAVTANDRRIFIADEKEYREKTWWPDLISREERIALSELGFKTSDWTPEGVTKRLTELAEAEPEKWQNVLIDFKTGRLKRKNA